MDLNSLSLAVSIICLAITIFLTFKVNESARNSDVKIEMMRFTLHRYFDIAKDIRRDMESKHKLPSVVYDEQGNRYVRMDSETGAFCYEKIES